MLHALIVEQGSSHLYRGVTRVILCKKNSSRFDQLKYVPWFCLPEMSFVLLFLDLMALYSAVCAGFCSLFFCSDFDDHMKYCLDLFSSFFGEL